jgi:HEAT repeat protein
MKHINTSATVLILGFAGFVAIGAVSIQEIKGKSDIELTALLSDSDGDTRCACLMALGSRFRNPSTPVILAPSVADATAHSKGVSMPKGLLEKTAALAKSDSDLSVRLAAVMALSSFKFHTNTTPVLNALLEDQCCIIKIRAAQALVGFRDEYHEPISDRVVQALIGCLDPKNSPDDLWQAASTVGNLGERAEAALPFLEKLERHDSPQVREYAKEAVLKLQKKSRRR